MRIGKCSYCTNEAFIKFDNKKLCEYCYQLKYDEDPRVAMIESQLKRKFKKGE